MARPQVRQTPCLFLLCDVATLANHPEDELAKNS
jgi:hypothetical protein